MATATGYLLWTLPLAGKFPWPLKGRTWAAISNANWDFKRFLWILSWQKKQVWIKDGGIHELFIYSWMGSKRLVHLIIGCNGISVLLVGLLSSSWNFSLHVMWPDHSHKWGRFPFESHLIWRRHNRYIIAYLVCKQYSSIVIIPERRQTKSRL